ncbi:hypothetical protein K491DRAFT_677785 [Lophiostoma macrostomum CBS 122681]|uniref:Cupredoxin n=1 Tax=Lophiostoma macrostomum CBS 122681 TaxID=1314788 RepID=A0A6A6TC51_9PLEO|nr:hypothetical protein K491DRAFT_677785 [Lophiostoma macrostomum CBS 122681]
MYSLATILTLATIALAAIHSVDVGEEGETFNPQTLTASPGDSVVFHLYSPHNVASSAYSSPCNATSSSFFSGPYSGTSNGAKKFVINVTSTDPIYFFCGVQKHCQDGMVGGINVDQLDQYKSAAKDVKKAEASGDVRGGELLGDSALASLSASASASSSSTMSMTSAATSSTASTTGSSPKSTGAAVAQREVSGFAAGVLAVAAYLV